MEIDGEIAAIVEINSVPERIWSYDNSSAYYVHKLAIRRKYSKRGLGRKVLELIKVKAINQGVNFLRLDCVSHNTKLRQYYEKVGFNCQGLASLNGEELALYEYEIKG